MAEPGVTFEALVRETLKYDLVPLIVPELKTITIGGAVAGGAVESMSFRHGTFHDSCLEYELVTGTGQIISCSPEKDPEIFGMVHSSFGTLGILTRLKFRLLPAAPFVRVEYVRFSTLASFMEAVRQHFESRDVDFMDGIIHSAREFVLCLGRLVGEAPYTHSYPLARRFPFLVKGSPDVAADVLIPIEKMKAFFDWYLEVFNYFPL